MQTKKTPEVWSLASGSKANCTLISSENTNIMIDFGVSCKNAKLKLAELGKTLNEIDAIFITHEHRDHINGLKTLKKNYETPVHMTAPSYFRHIREDGFDIRDKIIVHDLEYSQTVGDFEVSSFPVKHDSAACVGYTIKHKSGYSIGVCTDLGVVPDTLYQKFSCCDCVILESNHDTEMLKYGPYPAILKERISSENGHLSNADCAEILSKLAAAGVKKAFLAHISPENNTPELALKTIKSYLQKNGLEMEFINIAPRFELTKLG